MYLRVDPTKSAGYDLYVIDRNSDYNLLKDNSPVACLQGSHFHFPTAIQVDAQSVYCTETDSQIYTLIYKI